MSEIVKSKDKNERDGGRKIPAPNSGLAQKK